MCDRENFQPNKSNKQLVCSKLIPVIKYIEHFLDVPVHGFQHIYKFRGPTSTHPVSFPRTAEGTAAPAAVGRGAGSVCGSTALSWGKALPGASEDTAAARTAMFWAEFCCSFTV